MRAKPPTQSTSAAARSCGIQGDIVYRRAGAGVLVTETRYAGQAHLGNHRHETAYLSIALEGHYTEVDERETRSCPRWTLLYHPARENHADVFHGPARCMNVEVDDRLLEDLAAAGFPFERTFRAHGTVGPRFVEELEAATRRRSRDGVLRAFLDVIPQSMRSAHAAPAWLGIAVAMLQGEEDRTVRDIARASGVHPTYLASLVLRHFGMAPREMRARARFEQAARSLRSSALSIAELAIETGYSDQSHLSREFRRYAAMTPHAYRRHFGEA